MDFHRDQLFRLSQEFRGQHANARCPIANFVVLNLGDVDEDLGRRIVELDGLEDRSIVIGPIKPSLISRNIDASWAQGLSLVSWNIDAFSSQPVARAKLILDHILKGPKSPDIIFLQEITSDVRAALLDDARVRAALLVTDAEDQMSFEGMPFATMTLLSRARFASGPESQKGGDGMEGGGKFMLGCVSRVTLPSKYGRDGLYVDIIPLTAAGHGLPSRQRPPRLARGYTTFPRPAD